MNVTEADVQAVLNAHPALTVNGYGTPNITRIRIKDPAQIVAEHERDRRRLTGDRALFEIQAAADWLGTRQPRKTATDGPSSYGLKHVMERATGTYVTNGAFIAAALILGLPVDLDGLNPSIGVTLRSVNAAANTRGARP